MGATSICAEYLCDLPEPGILISINPGSRAGYSLPFILSQAIRQGLRLLGSEHVEKQSDYSPGDWHRVLTNLQRKARLEEARLHIIVDGLYQIPSDDERYVHDIIRNVLAIGNADVRHVITWDLSFGTPKFLEKAKVRTAALPALSDPEARRILEHSGVAPEIVSDAVAATEGIPAQIASIARISKENPLQKSDLSNNLSSYYNLEWENIAKSICCSQTELERFFATLIYSKRPLDPIDTNKIAPIPDDALSKIMERRAFITVDASGHFSFISNTHRDFLKNKLERLRPDILNAFVALLVSDTNSPDTVQLLPNYYEDLGRNSDLVESLSNENLDAYLAQTQSLTALRRRNEQGLKAAQRSAQLNLQPYRFALQTSIVRGMEFYSGQEERLAVLAAVGRFDEALSIAQLAYTKEARLRLLSLYTRILFEKGMIVDSIIFDNLKELIDCIDFSSDREGAASIAENLIGAFPELGFSIIEASANGANEYHDLAFTDLILRTQIISSETTEKVSEKYASRIKDSSLQDFLRVAEAIFKTKSAEEIKTSTAGFDGKKRAFFLRQWLKSNAKHHSALEVAEYALDEVVRDNSYLPTAGDLRDICKPIAAAADCAKAADLLNRVEAQSGTLLTASSTVETFRLALEIAIAKCAILKSDSESHLIELYIKATDLPNNELKLECLSWLIASLDRFESASKDSIQEVRTTLVEAINSTTEICLSTTAEHLDVFKGSISALVESNPSAALALVRKINTEDRRDLAYSYLIEKLISRRADAKIPCNLILEALASITPGETKWVTSVALLRTLAQKKPLLDESPKGIVAVTLKIDDPLGRAHATRWSLEVLNAYQETLDLKKHWGDFGELLNQIDKRWLLPELVWGYIESASRINREHAQSLLKEVEETSLLAGLPTPQYASLISNLARLSVVALGAVMRCSDDFDDELSSTISLINEVPSCMRRMDLLSDLAMRCHLRKKQQAFEDICDKSIIKLIQNSSSESKFTQDILSYFAYAPLYLRNQEYAEDLLQKLPSREQDACRGELITYFANQSHTSEPFSEREYKGAKMTYPEALRICSLISHLKSDSSIGFNTEEFVRAATSKSSSTLITAQHRADLAAKLKKKISESLPDKNNIQHDGWEIFCLAYTSKLSSEGSPHVWEDLFERAKNIPNTSDSVYVLSAISETLPPKLSKLRVEVLQEASKRLASIPSHIDRVRRALVISKLYSTSEVEKTVAKKLLKNAMLESFDIKDRDEAERVRKQIIDAAYSFDEEFAASLMEDIDEDPARAQAKANARQNLKFQKNRSALVEKSAGSIQGSAEDLGAISWDLLGSLNSNKVGPRRLDDIGDLLQKASEGSLEESMAFYWWYIRNAERKYEFAAKNGRPILKSLFEVNRLAALLSISIGRKLSLDSRTEAPQEDEINSGANLIAQIGQRDDVLNYIEAWIDRLGDDELELVICDPYFSPDEIEFIRDISFRRAGISFVVLSCKKSSGDLDLEYKQAWSRVAHVQLPEFRAVHLSYDGSPNRSDPIHDRWILSRSNGLRLGTSINSIGMGRLSEISEIPSDQVPVILKALQPYIENRRWIQEMRISYKTVQW